MVKIQRVASVPLIVNDPYFSIWSPADHLYDTDTESWTGKSMPIKGAVIIDGEKYAFMGRPDGKPVIPQVDLEITATQTKYTFQNELLTLELTFSTELDLNDFSKISEPVTIITAKAANCQAPVQLEWFFSDHFCYEGLDKPVINTNTIKTDAYTMQWMGKARQTPLNSSGDLVDIDWGFKYIASKTADEFAFANDNHGIKFTYPLAADETKSFLSAFDDLHAIEYFGEARNAYWHKNYNSMVELLASRLDNLEASLANCASIDQKVSAQAQKVGGDNFDFITAMSYRQAISAHKLITDKEGKVIFLSKECNSNGCIGTVDVSYPSIPLFLLYQPELVKGMMRPIYKFAALPVWEYDYAPHDVGRYPYANGQVYGMQDHKGKNDGIARDSYETIFNFYGLPAGQDIYSERFQMPIEECGNMLLMLSAVYLRDHDQEFFEENLKTNLQWADYLVQYGQDPDNQLCTDDFAGHLAHNTNLSLKAITALGLFGKVLTELGHEQGAYYTEKAKAMAKIWEQTADDGQWYRLAFDQEGSWSLKYNIVWDKLFNLGLFSNEVIEKELAVYKEKTNRYGIPLDNRASYTKADWIMWVSVLAEDKAQFDTIISPVKTYLEETESRVPFSDWYNTESGKWVSFKNRTVVGACFMPMLADVLLNQ